MEYKCSLSVELLEVAKNELRENESRRTQSIQQFRELILKHPQIKKCRTDEIFLLRFLRTKKFAVLAALEMLEKYLIIRQIYPKWYQQLDINDPKLNSLLECGYLFPLIQKDHADRQVIICCPSKLDINKYTSDDSIRLNALIFAYFLDQEVCQVAGFIYVIVGHNISMKYMSLFSLTTIRNWLKCIMEGIPVRQKEIHLLDFPSFANTLMDFGISTLTEKIRKRVSIHKDVEHLKDFVSSDILPVEFGGKTSISEMISVCKQNLIAYRDKILSNDDQYIEIKKGSTNWLNNGVNDEGVTGSFRKLEVD